MSFPCIEPGKWMCDASHICIDESKLCNKEIDCPMGDDEDPSCGKHQRFYKHLVRKTGTPQLYLRQGQ